MKSAEAKGIILSIVEFFNGFDTRVTQHVPKVVIRIRKSKKDRQHNSQKDKQRSTKHTDKTKDPVTPTALKTGGELRCSGR
jgi:hypothetical protein